MPTFEPFVNPVVNTLELVFAAWSTSFNDILHCEFLATVHILSPLTAAEAVEYD
jgi:hypothetical protein